MGDNFEGEVPDPEAGSWFTDSCLLTVDGDGIEPG